MADWTTFTCTLTCGCTFQLHAPTPEVHRVLSMHPIGGWYGCVTHSPVVAWDPTTGEPDRLARDQQLVSIEEVPQS